MTLAKPGRMDNHPPLPQVWLVTDEQRLPDPLEAIQRLPAGSGVVFRHHGWPERSRLAQKVAALCRVKRLVLLVANDWRLAAHIGAHGVHLAEGVARSGHLAACLGWVRRKRMLSVAAHSAQALHTAQDIGADFCLLSQAFASRSHPGQRPLGAIRFAALARRSAIPVIALGGMNHRSWKRLPAGCAHGWAGIDGLT